MWWPLLSGIDGNGVGMEILIRHIQRRGELRRYSAGESLFHAGDPAAGLFFVKKGEIRIFKMDRQGKEMEVVRLGNKSFFGEAILFTSETLPAYAEAVTESEVFFLHKRQLFEDLEKTPGLARGLLSLLARKCLILNQRIEVLGLQTVRQRLAHYLLSRCKGQSSCTISLDINKTELAKYLGTISETLSRNLKQLQDEKLIEVDNRVIHIRDCIGLRAEVSGSPSLNHS